MSSNKFRFTNRALEKLPPHDADSPSRSKEVSDSDVTGLRLLINKQGRKYFFYRFVFNGVKKSCKLGEMPPMLVDDARRLALDMRAKIDRGVNPLEDRERVQGSPTLAEFARNDYLPFAKQTKRSWRDDESRLRNRILPTLGHIKLVELQTRTVQQLHADTKNSHSAASANRILSIISRMYNLAIQWNMATRNPAAGIKKFTEDNNRQRFLSVPEIQRIFHAAETEEGHNKVATAAIRFLLLTGTRLNEALHAKWEHIDLEGQTWFLPHTKAGRSRFAQLSGAAVELLKSLPRKQGNPYVFPGQKPDKNLVDLRKPFARLLAAAGINEHIPIHQLRHTHASLMANSGVSLTVIQSALGHQSPSMTLRYSHMQNSTLRGASETVASAISNRQGVAVAYEVGNSI